ncbi:hypothetical protein C1E24_11605 [Pseudoalteromonas phenolica]|uniref:DUF7305 domain-containing protein n=1 Tax=Pseudoalteromonas phenolica TaxID=161398 RepID=A0A5R9Q1V0_9GAMM|nr:polymer-forming cytoskeletal protein [Pseudoalteromonas phenolica]TLX46895.1 hypothetical protein C1E24_11605 [Pseudoalteromonas phenolica]
MKQQSGFTLIKVMLMSTMASVVVFGALKETVIQERLTGNFQKDMNARLLAEKGIFTAAKSLQTAVSNNNNLTVDELVNQYGLHAGNGDIGDDTAYKARLSKNVDGLLEITSLGQRYYGDANQQLVARFELKPGEVKSPFQHAVTGCKGVNLSGSGVVDSYDSSKGPYSETNRDSSGHVNTVIGDSSVTIDGHSPIKGDIKASGIVYLKGSSPVIGDVHSNTGVDISWGSGVRVKGSVFSNGFYIHRGGEIDGVVRANGNAKMEWGSKIKNPTNDPYDIMYGGTGSFPSSEHVQDSVKFSDGTVAYNVSYSNPYFKKNPEVEPVEVYDPSSPDYDPARPNKECDPFELPKNMPNVIAQGEAQKRDFEVGATQVYQFTPSIGRLLLTDNGRKKALDLNSKAAQIYLFDNLSQQHGISETTEERVFSMKNFKLYSDGKMTIAGGDVIFLVDGNFILDGDAKLTIKDGSSLTVFTTGKVILGASGQVITEKEGMTASGIPSLNFFSSYSGRDGFQVKGASDMYATIYAPLTQVKLSGSGQLYGTVRGSIINSSGGSGVHFDSALKDVNFGSGGGSNEKPQLIFKGWAFEPAKPLPELDAGEGEANNSDSSNTGN